MLRQILGNLLSNAIKYSPGGGRVSLEVSRSDSSLRLAIVSRAVERHGGTVRVESELGRGTRFTVTLPTVME
ncbi:MAG: ATP-binding protein [Steroidobacteraceae bacterium]